ncbi:hypothetical protein TGAM01_v203589 [Trichoderma gamsii]|uniref:Uncharacterized protein n=1 Tax=Trichoderma gamsii TaxID=398673 RepID=A0A2P4ZU76_9HYPO|nr:hypothetical protein TGAM01_v203589 [Trichoderma gamsii]PON27822.1 hypothetical protein TGAM01_v203589 [Trichoderma gamsii]
MSGTLWYPVYKLKLTLTIQDPDMPSPRYHTVVFVQTNEDGKGGGVKFHVTGDIVTGMHYESTPYDNPDMEPTLFSKELIGSTKAADFLPQWDAVLETLQPPPKQKAFNTKTMRTEPVKSWDPLTFYLPGDKRQPLIKCTEWIEEQAIPILMKNGLIATEAK